MLVRLTAGAEGVGLVTLFSIWKRGNGKRWITPRHTRIIRRKGGGGLNTPMTRVPTGVFFGGVRDRPPAGVWCPRYHCWRLSDRTNVHKSDGVSPSLWQAAEDFRPVTKKKTTTTTQDDKLVKRIRVSLGILQSVSIFPSKSFRFMFGLLSLALSSFPSSVVKPKSK